MVRQGLRGRLGRLVTIGAAVMLAGPLLMGMAAPGGHDLVLVGAKLRSVPAQHPVPVRVVRSHRVRVPANPPWHRPAVSWPSARTGVATVSSGAAPSAGATGSVGSAALRASLTAAARISGSRANAELAGITRRSVRAGTTPVWVGPAVTAARPVALPGQVRVTIATRKVAAAAGVGGIIFGVSRATGRGPASVHVSLDYSSFAFADGGDYASRLHLVETAAAR